MKSDLSSQNSTNEVLLEVGAEGGSLTITRQRSSTGDWNYTARLNESAMADFLSKEDLGGMELTKSSNAVRSFQEALHILGRYRWECFFPVLVMPEFREIVFAEVEKRGGPKELYRWQQDLALRRSGG